MECRGGLPKGSCLGDGTSDRAPHICPERKFWFNSEKATELCNCCEACEEGCREGS